jgi:hypothetical protein
VPGLIAAQTAGRRAVIYTGLRTVGRLAGPVTEPTNGQPTWIFIHRQHERGRPLLPHSARSVEIIEPPTGSPTGMRYELSSKKVFVALRA